MVGVLVALKSMGIGDQGKKGKCLARDFIPGFGFLSCGL